MSARYGAGGTTGRRITDEVVVEKRGRDYNPEHRRQRRIGMAEAAALGGGGTALGFGGHGTYKDTKELRGQEVTTRTVNGSGKSVPGPNKKLGELPVGRGSLRLSRKNGALLLAGGAGLAATGALRRWAEGNRGRAYT